MLPKDQTDFGQAIADALKALEADGTYKSILTKWKTEGGAITDFAVNPPPDVRRPAAAADRPGLIHARPVRHPGRWVAIA